MSGQGQQQKGGNKPLQAPNGMPPMQTQQQYLGPAGSNGMNGYGAGGMGQVPQQTPVGGYGGPTSSFDAKWASQGFGGGMAPPDMRTQLSPEQAAANAARNQQFLSSARAAMPQRANPNVANNAMQRPMTGGGDPLAGNLLHGDPAHLMGGDMQMMRDPNKLQGLFY